MGGGGGGVGGGGGGVGWLNGMCPLECVHAVFALACWGLSTKLYPGTHTNAYMPQGTRA